jgi:DNA-binding XRE family transcriptional regulator
VDVVAKKLQVKEDKLVAWEKGEERPTFRQAENLAHVFRRPLSLFFMPRPPQIPPLAAEYRHLSSVEPGNESPELRLALRQMVARRENALNLMGGLGKIFPISPSVHIFENHQPMWEPVACGLWISVESQLVGPTNGRRGATGGRG